MNPKSNGRYVEYDYRCPNCARLFFRAYISSGTVLKIRCGRCNLYYVIGKGDDGMFFNQEAPNVTKQEALDNR